MRIAVVGAGRIGSTFAFHLARAGHEVTVVARGKRLDELQRTPAIVSVKGEEAKVTPAASLDPAVAWDLVLVTVLAHQVDAVLPALKASAAKTVMYLFNTFEKLDRLRDAVGADRAVFAFPTVTAFFVDGKLKSTVDAPGNMTTVGRADWVDVFRQAGIPTEHQPDMEAFLRSHVAFVLPLMVVGVCAWNRKGGATWAEASAATRAMAEAFGVVRALGHRVIPGFVAVLAALPRFLVTFLFWALSRTGPVRDLGSFGPSEVQQLIDAIGAAAPGPTPALKAARP